MSLNFLVDPEAHTATSWLLEQALLFLNYSLIIDIYLEISAYYI